MNCQGTNNVMIRAGVVAFWTKQVPGQQAPCMGTRSGQDCSASGLAPF